MRAVLLLGLALFGCADVQPAKPLIEDCVIQVLKSVNDTTFVARMHCEPEGGAT